MLPKIIKTLHKSVNRIERSNEEATKWLKSYFSKLHDEDMKLIKKMAANRGWGLKDMTGFVWNLFDDARYVILDALLGTPDEETAHNYLPMVRQVIYVGGLISDDWGSPPWDPEVVRSIPPDLSKRFRRAVHYAAPHLMEAIKVLGLEKRKPKFLRRKMTRRSEAF